MSKYLKMADVFDCEVESDADLMFSDSLGNVADFSGYKTQCRYATHAINTHDDLVAMNQELLAALELMVAIHDEPSGFSGKYGKALDDAIQAQEEKIDERLLMARTAIAKAKGGAA